MKICVINTSHSHSEHPWMDADVYRVEPRILSVSAICLLYDPNFIKLVGETPEVIEWDNRMPVETLEAADVIIVPQAMNADIEALLIPLARSGHKMLWVRPSAEALIEATAGKINLASTLHSHCESWNLPFGTFVWPQPVDYDAYESSDYQGLWKIGGDWPSILRFGNVTFGCGGIFHAYNWYWNSPADTIRDDGLFNSFQCAYLVEIACLLGYDIDAVVLKTDFFIRRDFHAFGFARQMICDLYKIKGKTPDFTHADAFIYQAAMLVGASHDEIVIERALRLAFEELYKIRCVLIDIPVYYAEALHAGILADDFGFIEFASPEFVKAQLETLLYFARRRKGHFSVDYSVISLMYLDRRHPSLTKLIKECIAEGIFEVCNGSIGQPYPHLFSLESNIRQLETGQKVLMHLYGQKAGTLLAQEMQLVQCYPAIIKQCGYNFALHRIQNKGAAVYENVENMIWRAPDGSEILTVPTHYDNSQQMISMVHMHWPQLISKAAETYRIGIFTNLLDNTWNTPFREESNRACYYAPIFGEFVTYRELAERLPAPELTREYKRRDYMPELQAGTSTLLSEMRQIGDSLESIEKYMALTGREDAAEILSRAWLDLGAHQNHDNTVVFYCPPQLRYMWPEARGPVRGAPLLYDHTRSKLLKTLAECENITGCGNGGALFNPLDRAREITLVKFGSRAVGVKRLKALDDSFSGIARLSFAAYGVVENIKFGDLNTCVSGVYIIENGLLRLELDTKNGCVKSVTDILSGAELLNGACALLSVGTDGHSKLLHARTLISDGIKQFVVRVELFNGEGAFAGWADQVISLPDNEKRIYFTTTFDPHLRPVYPERPSLRYSHARKTGLYAHYLFDKSYSKAYDCWVHQIDEAPLKPFTEFKTDEMFWYHDERMLVEEAAWSRTQSAMGLVVRNDDKNCVVKCAGINNNAGAENRSAKNCVIIHNDGAQIYEYDDSHIMQLLWAEVDYGVTFSYAIEWTYGNPFTAMLDYQYDLMNVTPAPTLLINRPIADNPDVWISSVRLIDGCLYVRAAETAGKPCETRIRLERRIAQAEFVDMLGETQRSAVVEPDGSVKINLGKNGICTLKIYVL